MKTITYSVSTKDAAMTNDDFASRLAVLNAQYFKHPERYNFANQAEAQECFIGIATHFAIFQQLERDGLASINKIPDPYYSFADHAGDIFNPELNTDFDKAELKRQERRERARFNRQGAYIMELVVEGDELDSIGGFVGDDFYGSGYDDEYYATAIEQLESDYPDYFADLRAVCKH